jgi:hypothetical protein
MPEKDHTFVQTDLQIVFWIKSWSMDSSSSSHKRQEIEAIGEVIPILVQFTFVSTFPAIPQFNRKPPLNGGTVLPKQKNKEGNLLRAYGPKPGFLKKSVFVPNYPNYLHL